MNEGSGPMRLGIVVPVYNEERYITRLFDGIREKISTPKKVTLIYDSDEDTTLPVVRSVKGRYDFEIELVKNRYGKGALNAIKTGLEMSDEAWVLVTMADLSDDLSCVDSMCEIAKNGVDIVCGSRYMRGGKQIGGPLLKRTLSRMAGVSLHYLTGIPTHDVTNSFKLYTRKMLQEFKIESTGGFELGMELTVKAFTHGYTIAELPSVWLDRMEGQSNFKMWSWMPRYIHWYLYCIKRTWLRRTHS